VAGDNTNIIFVSVMSGGEEAESILSENVLHSLIIPVHGHHGHLGSEYLYSPSTLSGSSSIANAPLSDQESLDSSEFPLPSPLSPGPSPYLTPISYSSYN
jgi:hypothetical protein